MAAADTNLRVKISADIQEIKRSLGLVVGELAKVKREAATTAPNMSGWSSGIANVRRELGALVGAYVSFRAVGGIIRGVMQSFDTMDRIDEMRQMVAMSSVELSKFAYAAKFSGVELEALGKGFFFFERNLIKNADLLRKIGVDAPSTAGKLRQLMDVFAAMPDGAEKAQLASELFGSRLAANLIPLLNAGSASFDELSEAAARTGNIFSDEATAAAAQFNDSMDTLKGTLAGVFNVTAQQLAPSMSVYAGEANAAAKENKAASETGRFLANVFKVIAVGAVVAKNAVEAVVNVLSFLADAAIATGKAVLGALGGAFTTVGASMNAFLTGGPLAAFNAFTAGIKQNAAAMLSASHASAAAMRAGWSAMKDGVTASVSDVTDAFEAAFAGVERGADRARTGVQGVGEAADDTTARGERLRKMLAALFAEGGGKDSKSQGKAKEAIKGLVDEGALAIDQIDRDLDALEQRYDDGQIKLAEYFAKRQELELQRIDLKIAEATADALAAKSSQEQSRALTEIIKLQRDRAAIGPKTAREQAKAEKEATAATLENLRTQLGNISGALSSTEESISAQISAGALGYAEGERRLQAVRRESIAQLIVLRDLQAAYIASLAKDDPNVAAAEQGLAGINTALANIGASMDRFGQDVEAGAFGALRSLFTSIREGGRLTVDALKMAIADFAASIYDSITGEWAKSIASTVRGFFGNMAGGAGQGAAEATAATTAATIQTGAATTAAATITAGATTAAGAITTGATSAGGVLRFAGSALAAAMVQGATLAAQILQAQQAASSIAGAAASAKGNVFGPGGFQAFAKGNVFGPGGFQAFAKGAAFALRDVATFAAGGAFTNRLFSVPTIFTFGAGGQFGIMGEAGPEAVMPLTRGPGGRLGVDAHGASGGPQSIKVINVWSDEAAASEAAASPAWERVVVNHVNNNRGKFGMGD